MSEVFISYSRRDSQVVDKIVQALHDAGVDAWIDREDIQAGNSWRLQIVEAIDECSLFVLALSPNSAVSDNVRKEIDLAQDSGRVIVPIMLEPVKIPAAIRYQLAGLQFLDVSVIGFEKAMQQLVSLARREISKQKKQNIQKTAELVIEGVSLASFGAEKQKQLLDFIANLTQTDSSQLRIQNLAAGSVHAFIHMPARTAYQLKTFALNHDARLAALGISFLRLGGASNLIEVASGNFVSPKPAGSKSGYGIAIALFAASVVGFLVLAVFVFGLFVTREPQSLPPPATRVISPAVSPIPPTETPTQTPSATPTASPTYTPMPEINRCELYEGMEMRFVTLQWLSGLPLNFYFRMPGGVPGLEREIEGDTLPWLYSVNLDGRITEQCEFIPGYKERLYCTIDIPSSYSYTLQPMTLSVNGCEQPIYENPIAQVPKIKAPSSSSSSSVCGDEMRLSDFPNWCSCMGGSMSSFGSCMIP